MVFLHFTINSRLPNLNWLAGWLAGWKILIILYTQYMLAIILLSL